MLTDCTLLLIRSGQTYDISQLLVGSVQWSGRKGASARTMTATLLESGKYPRSGIDAVQGNHLIFLYKGAELFRGLIFSDAPSDKETMSIKAFDNGVYLSNNRDTFCYKSKTLTQIFRDICTRFEIPYSAAESGYKIPSLKKSAATAWDVLQEAMSATFTATGRRYWIYSEKDRLELILRRETTIPWVLEPGVNLISYNLSTSIEKTRTRLKMVWNTSDIDTTILLEKRPELESRIGIMQEIESVSKGTPRAQYLALGKQKIAELAKPVITLSVEAIGIADIISGRCVHAILPNIAGRTYYVDEDAHTFDGTHRMRLKLTRTEDEI
ncbi:MAG: hypothetical protein LBT21_06250 [Oscillospiraceae bacterium]|nr:hypothetical protein [Oscillospiraceae bacterium]